MTDRDEQSRRLDALEARVAYQDRTIETLNETVTAQWRDIDALRRRVAELGERLRDAESNGRDRAVNERPPHY
ncbi:MAG: SlyX family protein [Xanthobacteraceae bacterium]